jgi:eukaryotic-like serine/threonine-protein kinase
MSDPPVTGVWPPPAGTGPSDWPIVPGYDILAELGRGGMGVVYKARHLGSQQLVALKLIRDIALAGPQERSRFRVEAEAAARMRHPNIVQIYQVGEHQGRPYFAMELLEGGSLDKCFAGQPQPASLAAELIRTLARAVQHAHDQQVVHRDLKPANILLCKDEGGRMKDETDEPSFLLRASSLLPKITDFGLAKRLDSASTALTHDGAVLGTAGYMAPEQAAGRSREIGPAVDIYALGAILYEALTGRPPFQSDSWNHALEQVLYDEPTPPTRWRADVPRDLETVCLKCLEKDPARRYLSAAELADDLDRFTENKPVAAVPLGARERLARLAARDGYQLGDEIGRGPRTTVYRALHGPLQQAIALKVFPEGICTREDWEGRFQSGATLWATLAHPHIVAVQRAGWWDGAPYVALEYVPQGSLAARLAGRPYSIHSALQLLEKLTEIVMYLHRQGVVHGNLKPSNILLAANGIPRVCDSRATGGLFLGAPNYECAGVCYLAPELIAEPKAEPNPHADIYGLGLILYEMLTSQPAFAAPTPRETLEHVCLRDPISPSQLNADVTPHLERFCLRCMRRNPWRRYHRAFDLLRLIHHFQDNTEETRGRRSIPE